MVKKGGKKGKTISILIFILINIIVFNRDTITHSIKSVVGFGSLQLYEVKTVNFDYDIEQGIIPKITALDDYIITVVDSKITLFSNEGEAKWQHTNELEDIIISGNKNFFVATDYIKGNIFVYDYRGNINASIYGEGEIASVLVSEDGYIIVQMSGSNMINIYDPKLNQIAELKINQGEIVEIDINEVNKFIYVSTIDVDDIHFNSYLYKYDINGNLVGSIQMVDEILFEYYFEKDELIKISDKEIAIYSEDMEPILVVNNFGIIDLTAYKEDVIITQIYDDKSDINKETSNYDTIAFDLSKNEVIFNKTISTSYDEIFFYKSNLVCYNNNIVALINLNGELIEEFNLTADVTKLSVLNNDMLVMSGVDYFSIFELKH